MENGHTKLQEDSRAISSPRDFGLLTCSGNLIAENPNLAELNVRKSGCPGDFDIELLGLINNARARHQAPPLSLVKSSGGYKIAGSVNFADISAASANQYTRQAYVENDRGYVQLTYSLLRSAPDLHANLTSPMVAKALYTPGLTKYHSYGSEPENRNQTSAFTALVWKAATEVGIGCTTFHTFDAATKVRMIDTKVNVVLTLGNSGNDGSFGEGKSVAQVNSHGAFSENVLAPNDITWTDYVVNIQSEDNILIDDDNEDEDDHEGDDEDIVIEENGNEVGKKKDKRRKKKKN